MDSLTLDHIIKAKKALERMNYNDFCEAYCGVSTNSLGTLPKCTPQVCMPYQSSQPCAKQKKENNMRNVQFNNTLAQTADLPTDQKQRDYALNRLGDVKCTFNSDLRKQFHLEDDEAPTSMNDLLTRFSSGKFTFPEDKKDKKLSWWGVMETIRWRDPAVKADEDGYETATDALDKAYWEARDGIVMSKDAEAAKATLDAFKGWTYTAPTTTTVQ